MLLYDIRTTTGNALSDDVIAPKRRWNFTVTLYAWITKWRIIKLSTFCCVLKWS